MMSRKGQAAMEFLMTYGWAILIAVIAIAALIAFGVLNPGKNTQNTCGTANAIMPNLGCTEMKVTAATGALTLIITNGLGTNIQKSDMYIEPGCSMTVVAGSVADSSNATFTASGCSCTNGRYKGNIHFNYTMEGETLPHTVTAPLNVRCE